MRKKLYIMFYCKPMVLLFFTIASVFASELLIMLLLYDFSHLVDELLDATLLSLLIAPALYVLLYVPLIRNLKNSEIAQEELKHLNCALEEKVAERTRELNRINRLLEEEYTEALRFSEERYKSVIESLGVGVSVIKSNMTVESANDQMLRWHPNVDVTQNPICHKVFISEDATEECENCPVKAAFEEGVVKRGIVERVVAGKLRSHQIIASPIINKDGDIVAVTEVVEDVTEQKEYNENLEQVVRKRTNELSEADGRYQSLVQNSSDAIFIFDPITLKVQEVNKQFLALTGYSETETRELKLEDFVLADKESINAYVNYMTQEYKTINVVRQYKTRSGSVLDVEVNGSLIKYGETKVCLVNVRDISERKKAEKALTQSLQELKKTLYAGVNALVQLAEKKDPYTAGHQKRVSLLAVEIAKEMGLDEAKIECVRLAGALHDIGKINIPIDLLNKPGRLTEIELGLIKTHSQVSFEVLEQIPFKSDVAQVVLQHHERVNGSGYPNGLTGESILIGAKILSVADVIEAMSSHRPYRPAIGFEAAVQEIMDNKGSLYDEAVVDAFLRLLKCENGFVQQIIKQIA